MYLVASTMIDEDLKPCSFTGGEGGRTWLINLHVSADLQNCTFWATVCGTLPGDTTKICCVYTYMQLVASTMIDEDLKPCPFTGGGWGGGGGHGRLTYVLISKIAHSGPLFVAFYQETQQRQLHCLILHTEEAQLIIETEVWAPYSSYRTASLKRSKNQVFPHIAHTIHILHCCCILHLFKTKNTTTTESNANNVCQLIMVFNLLQIMHDPDRTAWHFMYHFMIFSVGGGQE